LAYFSAMLGANGCLSNYLDYSFATLCTTNDDVVIKKNFMHITCYHYIELNKHQVKKNTLVFVGSFIFDKNVS